MLRVLVTVVGGVVDILLCYHVMLMTSAEFCERAKFSLVRLYLCDLCELVVALHCATLYTKLHQKPVVSIWYINKNFFLSPHPIHNIFTCRIYSKLFRERKYFEWETERELECEVGKGRWKNFHCCDVENFSSLLYVEAARLAWDRDSRERSVCEREVLGSVKSFLSGERKMCHS